MACVYNKAAGSGQNTTGAESAMQHVSFRIYIRRRWGHTDLAGVLCGTIASVMSASTGARIVYHSREAFVKSASEIQQICRKVCNRVPRWPRGAQSAATRLLRFPFSCPVCGGRPWWPMNPGWTDWADANLLRISNPGLSQHGLQQAIDKGQSLTRLAEHELVESCRQLGLLPLHRQKCRAGEAVGNGSIVSDCRRAALRA